jgi:hypothetical protein
MHHLKLENGYPKKRGVGAPSPFSKLFFPKSTFHSVLKMPNAIDTFHFGSYLFKIRKNTQGARKPTNGIDPGACSPFFGAKSS